MSLLVAVLAEDVRVAPTLSRSNRIAQGREPRPVRADAEPQVSLAQGERVLWIDRRVRGHLRPRGRRLLLHQLARLRDGGGPVGHPVYQVKIFEDDAPDEVPVTLGDL